MMPPLSTTHMQYIWGACWLDGKACGAKGRSTCDGRTNGRLEVVAPALPRRHARRPANLNNACLSKRVDFGQVNPKEYVRLWGLMAAGTVHSKRVGIYGRSATF
jgi:hypothetical protein